MRRIRRSAALIAMCVAGVFATFTIPAVAATPIGPGQFFIGKVNSAAQDGKLVVLCVGPSATGHPVNDSIAVEEAPNTGASAGATGRASQISVDLTAPVAPSPDARVYHLATVRSYGSQELDPSLVLPCVPDGVVTFTPVDGGPDARPISVRVTIINPGS